MANRMYHWLLDRFGLAKVSSQDNDEPSEAESIQEPLYPEDWKRGARHLSPLRLRRGRALSPLRL